MAEQFLTVDDVAKRLKLSDGMVRKMVSSGMIPHTRFGTSIRFNPEVFERWIAEQSKD